MDNFFGVDLGKVVEDIVKGKKLVPKYRALSIKIKNCTAENRLGMVTSLLKNIMDKLESRTIF